jgi:hypothetical protein
MMTDPDHVTANETGLVRVYDVTLPETETLHWEGESPESADRIRAALGAETLQTDHVEFFDVATLGDLGLTGYMNEGLGIPPEALEDRRAELENIAGHVLIVLSRAFGGTEQRLSPGPSLRLVGAFSEDRPPVRFDPLPAGGAEGAIAPTGVPATPPRGGAMWVLALVALAIGLLIWLLL